ncbi:uncharacterized protein [Asterias amurensis]|uniref:uncharacterized protein n=1 Tax=Asterias amurensis TaxID=7602 RepID=UPI003AB42FE7
MALCWRALVVTFAVFLPFSTAAGFIDTPGTVVVHVGETAILQCSVDLINVQGSMTMYWYKGMRSGGGVYVTIGQSVQAKGFGAERYSLDTSNVRDVFTYNLMITNAELADSGQYQCVAVDQGGTSRTDPGSLSVVQEASNEPLRCSIYPEAPTLGQTVTFSCIAPRGISPDMLTWWMDGTVQIQPEAHLANEHGISFVKTLAEADNFAEFTCLVGSSFSTTRNGMNCSVTPLAVPIRAEVTPSVLNAVIAGKATFRCRGTAIPSVQRYRWLYGSGDSTIKIAESKGRFSVVNNGDSSTFTITRLTAEDNSMMVRCVVMNAITKTFGLAELHVSSTQAEITNQQTTTPTAQPDEVSSLSTTIARNQDTTSGITPGVTYQVSTKAEVADTTGTHATTEHGTGVVINVHGCVENCGEKLSPQQNPSDNSAESGNGAVAAVISLLAICALVIVAIVYLVYKKKGGPKGGRVLKRKLQKNKAIERLRSLRLSTVSTSNQDLVTRDSVRLKTIEVIVNPPPPVWKFRVHDVRIEGAARDENATSGDNPTPVVTSDDVKQDGDELDALYAKPDQTKKKRKKHHGRPHADGIDAHLPVESPPSAVGAHYLSVDTDDADYDGFSDASTWDMSSVDSGCEETDEIHEDRDVTYAELDLATGGEVGKTCPPQTETVDYADITISDETIRQ